MRSEKRGRGGRGGGRDHLEKEDSGGADCCVVFFPSVREQRSLSFVRELRTSTPIPGLVYTWLIDFVIIARFPCYASRIMVITDPSSIVQLLARSFVFPTNETLFYGRFLLSAPLIIDKNDR